MTVGPARDGDAARCCCSRSAPTSSTGATCCPGLTRLRARARADGRAADRDRAGRRPRRARRHRQRRQQRRRPRRLAARRRRTAAGRRALAATSTPTRRASTRRTARRCWSARCCCVVGGLVSWFTIPGSDPTGRLPRLCACADDGEAGQAAAAALALLLGACSERGAPSRRSRPRRRPRTAVDRGATDRDPGRPGGRPGARRRPARPARRTGSGAPTSWCSGTSPSTTRLVRQIERLEGVAAHRADRPGPGHAREPRAHRRRGRPGDYRLFTRAEVADFQEAWDRVAGGEVAIDQKVAKRLRRRGRVDPARHARTTPRRCTWARSPRRSRPSTWSSTPRGPTTSRWPPTTALLISTDDIAPATIRQPLEQLVGEDVTVQMLDVASRLGLDPDATQTAIPTGGSLGASSAPSATRSSAAAGSPPTPPG